MNPFTIAPSILAANFASLGQEVYAVLEAGAHWIHIDVMDNHYVPNLTFGPMVLSSLRNHGINAFFDVHLMIEPVNSMIEPFVEAGANMISFHPEASLHPHRTVQLIKSLNCQAGIAINPATPLNVLDYLWEDIDMILIMSVNPGFGGQKFITSALNKLKQAHHLIQKHNPKIRLEIDGGVNAHNIQTLANNGADTFVAGSAIFNSQDYKETITLMKKNLQEVNP